MGKRSLRSYVWMYFIFFTVFILVLIWLFQYYFLDSYYESAKIRDVQKAASKIVRNYDKDDIQNISRQLAFDNSLCIVVLDEMGNIKLVENNIGSYSYFYDDLENNFGIFLFKLKNEFNSSDENISPRSIRTSISKARKFSSVPGSTAQIRTNLCIYL